MMRFTITNVKKIFNFIITYFLVISNGETFHKKRVCVIGAGRAGLAAVKLVSDHPGDFELVAFERNSVIGGLWNYRDDPNLDEHGLPAYSGIYKHLRTNLAKINMVYPDYPNFEGEDNREFVSHEMVLEYMKNYTDYFQLHKYIELDTLVTKVMPTKGNGDWKTTTWRIEMRNLNTNKESSRTCDAVIVCNGHFSKPNMPKIPGMETFPSLVLHSRSYRKPENFTDQTVVVLGAGDSGKDISVDLSISAKQVYLSYRHDDISIPKEYPNLKTVRGVVSAKGSQLTLQDSSTITADAFIFCTGYLYEFPFLDKSSGIIIDGKHVRPLYEKFINVEHPSMSFVGLTDTVDYGRLYYWEVNFILELLLGTQQLPSYEEMLRYSR